MVKLKPMWSVGANASEYGTGTNTEGRALSNQHQSAQQAQIQKEGHCLISIRAHIVKIESHQSGNGIGKNQFGNSQGNKTITANGRNVCKKHFVIAV